ncbi:hypothetical protein F4810DRAFT_48851 [Camillea tinctor]|nr:hypothetical protein F4810DRAFT_48851 [Camillea tinctor]
MPFSICVNTICVCACVCVCRRNEVREPTARIVTFLVSLILGENQSVGTFEVGVRRQGHLPDSSLGYCHAGCFALPCLVDVVLVCCRPEQVKVRYSNGMSGNNKKKKAKEKTRATTLDLVRYRRGKQRRGDGNSLYGTSQSRHSPATLVYS